MTVLFLAVPFEYLAQDGRNIDVFHLFSDKRGRTTTFYEQVAFLNRKTYAFPDGAGSLNGARKGARDDRFDADTNDAIRYDAHLLLSFLGHGRIRTPNDAIGI